MRIRSMAAAIVTAGILAACGGGTEIPEPPIEYISLAFELRAHDEAASIAAIKAALPLYEIQPISVECGIMVGDPDKPLRPPEFVVNDGYLPRLLYLNLKPSDAWLFKYLRGLEEGSPLGPVHLVDETWRQMYRDPWPCGELWS